MFVDWPCCGWVTDGGFGSGLAPVRDDDEMIGVGLCKGPVVLDTSFDGSKRSLRDPEAVALLLSVFVAWTCSSFSTVSGECSSAEETFCRWPFEDAEGLGGFASRSFECSRSVASLGERNAVG